MSGLYSLWGALPLPLPLFTGASASPTLSSSIASIRDNRDHLAQLRTATAATCAGAEAQMP